MEVGEEVIDILPQPINYFDEESIHVSERYTVSDYSALTDHPYHKKCNGSCIEELKSCKNEIHTLKR